MPLKSCTTDTRRWPTRSPTASRMTPRLAEDVVQDAFLGAWRNAARYVEGRGSVKTWLLSIVHHRAIDAIRRRRPTSELPESTEAPPAALTEPDIWAEVAAGLDAEMVRGAMDVLSPPQREAIELAYFSGLTQVEIAERTGAPLGTVKSRMRLGLLAMRQSPGSGRATAAMPVRLAASHDRSDASHRADLRRRPRDGGLVRAGRACRTRRRRRSARTSRRARMRTPRSPSSGPCCRSSMRPCRSVEPPGGTEGLGSWRRPRRSAGGGTAGGDDGPAAPASRRRSRSRPTCERPEASGPPRSAGRCASRRSSRSSPSPAGTCCCRASSTDAQQYEQNVAAVLDAAQQPGARGRDPLAGRRDGLGHRGDQRGRRHHDGDARPRRDERRPGLRGVGHRRRRRAGAARQLPGGSRRDGVPGCGGRAGDGRPGPGAHPGAGGRRTTPTMPIISKGVATSAG